MREDGGMHTPDDGAVTRITRAFDAALSRFATADSFDEQEDEASNLLHHLYRLAVAICGEPNKQKGILGWESLISATTPAGVVPPLILLRHKDVHDHVEQTTVGDFASDSATNLTGKLHWDLGPMMDADPRTARYFARERLDKCNLFDTFASARSALAPTDQTSS